MSRKNPYASADARTRAARAQGYPARSVFKLEEIDRRVSLFRAGQHVLDLGAAPGSWSLYAAQRVGTNGRVLAIDLQELRQVFPANVCVIQGDVTNLESQECRRFAPYDVVLSDMAPSTSGNKVRDQAQSTELFLKAVELARELGRAGSHFVGKIFMSEDFSAARDRVHESWGRVQVIRPDGTRSQSSEVFVIGVALKGSRPNQGS